MTSEEPGERVGSEEARGKRLAFLSLAALVVVYGDIGTSPLYAIRECFHGTYAIEVTRDNILVVLSLVLWALLIVVTMTLSDVMNNTATAVIAAPIAVDIATRLQVNPDPFLMAVAVAASCAFLTPIGHKNNTLIMGPGGYQFGDYWRMGLPLEILIVLVSVPLILWAWPV